MPRRPDRIPRPLAAVVARLVAVPLAVALSAGCSLERWTPRTYEPPLQQGNVIDPDAVAKLKPGMTRSQVRFLLGTPMVVDLFRTDRWDYVYLHRRQGEPTRQRRLAVFFEGDQLVRVQADTVSEPPPLPGVRPETPSAAGAVAPGATPARTGSSTPAAGGTPDVPAGPPAAAAAPGAAAGAAGRAPPPAADAPSRGVFGRLLERIGL